MHRNPALVLAAAALLALPPLAAAKETSNRFEAPQTCSTPSTCETDAATRAQASEAPSLRGEPLSDAAALSQRAQDLRWLRAGNSIRTSSLSGTSERAPARHPQLARPVNGDDGTPWPRIAIGLAGACLLVGGATAIGLRRRRRAGRTRIAA